ncbi:alpha/beta hydrolase [Massilia horti]|uniref:Alpha/beta hydrolase n=2 Tax=Massilia horti TaxID=2562153 RepID=A0A4Y9TAE5_9BURK|nr:alpha/beta hydrolase [Massilia horti]
MAASYLFVRAKTRQAEREHPPQGKFVEVDGVRLHYLERGRGPALVLLHGNIVASDDFDQSGVIDRAAERYRVIAFDRPGYGYSERPRTTLWTPQEQARLLHHALQELGVDSALVLGHSWGTMVALAMAQDVPDFVRGLILLSGYYYPSLRLDVPLMSPPAIPVLGDLLRYTVSPLVWRLRWPLMAKFMFSPQPVPERFWRIPPWLMVNPRQLRASAAESLLMVPSAMVLSRHYAELKVPAAIVAGTHDKMASFKHNAEHLAEQVPENELTLEPGVGHMTHYAHPEKVMEAIDAMAAAVGEPPAIRSPRAEALARASESGV